MNGHVSTQDGRLPRVVVVGGGTGSHTILTGLKEQAVDLTAVVAMTDRGGSSGRLRDEFGHLPPGDVRQCMVALMPEEHSSLLLRQLFSYRFPRGEGLNGHSFGNLFITALEEITGGIDRAIQEAGRILGIKGRVIPVTLTKADLCARLVDGTVLKGEDRLDVREEKAEVPIDYVYTDPRAYVNTEAAKAIAEADVVILGPGDLYTSVIANLVVEGVPEAIDRSSAKTIFVCNLATKRGESDGFRASDFVRTIAQYLGSGALDTVLVNSSPVPDNLKLRYESEASRLVETDLEECRALVPEVVARPVASAGTLLRHHPGRLANAIMEIIRSAAGTTARDNPPTREPPGPAETWRRDPSPDEGVPLSAVPAGVSSIVGQWDG